MRKYFFTIALFFICLLPTDNHAKTTDIEVDLITIGAGQYYWEAFGHSALRIKTQNYDYMYGFGYFDFEDEDFFLNFAKGEMQYFMAVQDATDEIKDYQEQGRKIWSQRLDLSTSQKYKLINTLNFLAQEQNRYYPYDYFLNNCTSRIRDILDEVTGGDISKQLKNIQTDKSWSDLTFPVNNQAWMNLGIAVAYGLPAYSDRNRWQLSVFPEGFSDDIAIIKTSSNWNHIAKLLYQPTEQQSKVNQYSFINSHYAVLIIVLLLFLGLYFKISRTFTTNLWLLTQSLLGVGLLMLWFLTKHSVATYNINVLIFFPFVFLLLFKTFRVQRFVKFFLLLNLSWVFLAIYYTSLYLSGFVLVNIIIYSSMLKERDPKTSLFYRFLQK